jgi:hypothetical protein
MYGGINPQSRFRHDSAAAPFPQNQRIRKSLIDMTFQNSNRQKLLRGASVDVRRWAVFPLRGRQHGDIDSAV